MKIKINWGTGIVIAMIIFMAFILQYVYRAAVYDRYDHHLVADDYYKDELNYQNEIDKENRANKLIENIKLVKTKNGLEIIFPKQFDSSKLKGTIKLLRPSNFKLDLKKNITLTSNTYIISDKELVSGNYDVTIDWSDGTDTYLFKIVFFY